MNRFFKWFPIIVGLVILSVTKGFACSCLPKQSIEKAFEGSDVVVVANLQGFEEVNRSEQGTMVFRRYAALMSIEKVYKGSLKEKQTIKVYSGGEGDCSTGYLDYGVGSKFLLYTSGPIMVEGINQPLYWVSLCSRSNVLEQMKEDVAFLDRRINPNKSRRGAKHSPRRRR